MKSHSDFSNNKYIGWFQGKDIRSEETYYEDWRKTARENVEFEPLEEFKIEVIK